MARTLKIRPSSIQVVFSLCAIASSLRAAEFSGRVVDNFSSPVAGATLYASCTEPLPGGRSSYQVLFQTTSGPDGAVRVAYELPANGCADRIFVRASYENVLSMPLGELRPELVIPREVQPEQLNSIAQLTGEELRAALRSMLTSSVQGPFYELMFRHQDRFLPVLRSLAEDPDAGAAARDLLAFMGDPEDLRRVIQLDDFRTAGNAIFTVVCSLVEPTSEEGWALLRDSALGKYAHFSLGWGIRGAIQSLQLNASPRSREILEEAGGPEAEEALAYIKSNPKPLHGPDLKASTRRVAQALKVKEERIGAKVDTIYNEGKDKALVSFSLEAKNYYTFYDAIFHRIDGIWILRGVQEREHGG